MGFVSAAKAELMCFRHPTSECVNGCGCFFLCAQWMLICWRLLNCQDGLDDAQHACLATLVDV
jgi:hypothetical protein